MPSSSPPQLGWGCPSQTFTLFIQYPVDGQWKKSSCSQATQSGPVIEQLLSECHSISLYTYQSYQSTREFYKFVGTVDCALYRWCWLGRLGLTCPHRRGCSKWKQNAVCTRARYSVGSLQSIGHQHQPPVHHQTRSNHRWSCSPSSIYICCIFTQSTDNGSCWGLTHVSSARTPV